MANTNVDLNAIIAVAEPLALDIIGWVRRRQAEGQELPTDAEVVARAKAKAQAIVAEGQQALNEFPDAPAGTAP